MPSNHGSESGRRSGDGRDGEKEKQVLNSLAVQLSVFPSSAGSSLEPRLHHRRRWRRRSPRHNLHLLQQTEALKEPLICT